MSTKLTFLSPSSSLEIMHVLRKCYIENAIVCKIHKFSHQSVHYSVIFCDKSDFINFLDDYNRYKEEIFKVY